VVGRITRMFPLSADVITASFSLSFALIVCMARHSVWDLWENLLLFCRCSWVMQIETCFLKYGLSAMGSKLIAVSASRAISVNQCLFLWCKLYLRPLFSRVIPLSEKVMSVLLTTLG